MILFTFYVQVYVKESKKISEIVAVLQVILDLSLFLLVRKTGIIWFVIHLEMITTGAWKLG